MKTYSLKQGDIRKEWQLLDARGMVLGRLAAHIASILRGKHKPEFSPHLDCGDPVVVINAAEVRLTGNKLEDKRFYWHTGYPGGIKEISPKKQLEGKFPERLLLKAVERMLPKGPLGRQQMSQLKVFAGAEHRHEAQSPKAFDFAAQNSKNTPRPR